MVHRIHLFTRNIVLTSFLAFHNLMSWASGMATGIKAMQKRDSVNAFQNQNRLFLGVSLSLEDGYPAEYTHSVVTTIGGFHKCNSASYGAVFRPLEIRVRPFSAVTTLTLTVTVAPYDQSDGLGYGSLSLQSTAFHYWLYGSTPPAFTPRAMYDGDKTLFALHELPLVGQGSSTYEISSTGKVSKRIIIKPTARDPVDFQPWRTEMAGAIHVLQQIIRQIPLQSYAQKGKSFFSPDGCEDLRNGIQICRGLFQSIRPTRGGMVVNVDISASTFYTPGNLVDISMQSLQLKSARELELQKPDQLKNLEAHLKHRTIRICVRPNHPCIKTIKGLQLRAGDYRFELDGVTTTVAEYYKKMYNRPLALPFAVGVNHRSKNSGDPEIIPLEFCEMVPGQLYRKPLPPHLTDAMVSFTTVKPAERLAMIASYVSIRK
ncbi:PAZ domain-containing protein [Pterulicium gracile]|uniref:PAZ domain-containing protein n=1 Tax=Pterulicium gracile TaxID=1884261 RepID=A0A5C3Q9X5_9AGAR|nr:PAZ domain-containing protein [Pterula gracilis]